MVVLLLPGGEQHSFALVRPHSLVPHAMDETAGLHRDQSRWGFDMLWRATWGGLCAGNEFGCACENSGDDVDYLPDHGRLES